MDKRKALAGAGAITLTAAAGALAIGAAFGMGGLSDTPSKTGRLSPAGELVESATKPQPTPIVETIVVDVPAPASSSDGVAASASSDPFGPDRTVADDNEPAASPAYEGHEDEDSHADEDDPSATDDHANEDTNDDEDD